MTVTHAVTCRQPTLQSSTYSQTFPRNSSYIHRSRSISNTNNNFSLTIFKFSTFPGFPDVWPPCVCWKYKALLFDQMTTTTTMTTVMFHYVRLSAAAAALTTAARSSSPDSRRRPTQSVTQMRVSEYVSRLIQTIQLKFAQRKVVPETSDHVQHDTRRLWSCRFTCAAAQHHNVYLYTLLHGVQKSRHYRSPKQLTLLFRNRWVKDAEQVSQRQMIRSQPRHTVFCVQEWKHSDCTHSRHLCLSLVWRH